MRIPVSRPVSSTATEAPDTWTPASARRPEMSPRPSSIPNQNRPGKSASTGSAHNAASKRGTHSRTSALPPSRPESGEATMLRTRSWVDDGSSPAPAMASATRATASSSRMPRIWILPRDVSSIAGEPYRVAAWASASSWCGSIMPPGSRILASAPSAAWCTASAPGHASWSRVRATTSPYACTTPSGVVDYACVRTPPHLLFEPWKSSRQRVAGHWVVWSNRHDHPVARALLASFFHGWKVRRGSDARVVNYSTEMHAYREVVAGSPATMTHARARSRCTTPQTARWRGSGFPEK